MYGMGVAIKMYFISYLATIYYVQTVRGGIGVFATVPVTNQASGVHTCLDLSDILGIISHQGSPVLNV